MNCWRLNYVNKGVVKVGATSSSLSRSTSCHVECPFLNSATKQDLDGMQQAYKSLDFYLEFSTGRDVQLNKFSGAYSVVPEVAGLSHHVSKSHC